MKLKLILLLLLIRISVHAQYSHQKNWFFGEYAGLSFSGTCPGCTPAANAAAYTAVPRTINSLEACATESDASGQLLFYTDGIKVWNSSHVQVPGPALTGELSTAQGALILKAPGFTTKYYLFTLPTPNNLFSKVFAYTELSATTSSVSILSANNPVFLPGDVQNLSEMMTAVPNCSNNGYWIIVHGAVNASPTTPEYAGSFLVYSLTSSGLGGPEVYTFANNLVNIGQLKASPDGTKLAHTNGESGEIFLFDFDKGNGKISNPRRKAHLANKYTYGISFSPDSKRLYASVSATIGVLSTDIFQYDLSNNDLLTEQLIVTLPCARPSLLLAPDKKIYVSLPGSSSLGVINNPDLSTASYAAGPSFTNPAIISQSGLPNMVDATQDPWIVSLTCNPANGDLCSRGYATISAPPGHSYSWSSDPYGFQSSAQTVTVSPLVTTTYTVQVKSPGGCITTVSQVITPAITNNTISVNGFCSASDPRVFTGSLPSGGTGPYTYQWEYSPSAGGSYSPVLLATGQNYTAPPGSVFCYRRKVTSGSCVSYSNEICLSLSGLWPQTAGYSGARTEGTSVVTDSDGNVYVGGRSGEYDLGTGSSYNPVSFANGSYTTAIRPANKFFVAKYSSCGDLIWVAYGEGGHVSQGVYVALDPDEDYVYLASTSVSDKVVDPGSGPTVSVPGLGSLGDPAAFVLKFTASAGAYSAKYTSATGSTYVNGLTVNSNGVYVCGNQIVSGVTSGFVHRTDLNLSYLSSIAIKNTAGDPAYVHAICSNSSGDVFLTGVFNETLDISPYPTAPVGLWDTYLVKFNGSLAPQWTAQTSVLFSQALGGAALLGNIGSSSALCTDKFTGDIYLGGDVGNSFYFAADKPFQFELYGYGYYVLKVPDQGLSAGMPPWVNTGINHGVESITIDMPVGTSSLNVYITADKITQQIGCVSGLTGWTNSNGYGARAIACGPLAQNSIYVAGTYSGTHVWNSALTAAGTTDMYVARLMQVSGAYYRQGAPAEGSPSIDGFSVYPNPAAATFSLKVNLSADRNIGLKVYDLSGKLVKSLAEETLKQGAYEYEFDCGTFENGIYIIRLESDLQPVNRKLVIAR